MAEPRRDPETGGRSLAEILREAGIESPTRGRRRREDDDDDTGIRQRRADAEAPNDTGRVAGRPYGRRAGDLRLAGSSPAGPTAGPSAGPSTAALPGMRPSGKPDVPGPAEGTGLVRRPEERRPEERRADDRRAPERRAEDRRPGDRRASDVRSGDRRAPDRRAPDRRATDRRVADVPVAEDRRVADRRQGDRRLDDRRRGEDRPPVDERRAAVEPRPDRRAAERRGPSTGEHRRERVPAPAAPLDDNPSTGPIPVVSEGPDAAELDGTPQEGALAWLRFAGELVIALAAGVAIYFLFTAIWENLPYLAVVLAPLAVTGLVAGVGAYRHKMSRDPVGPKLLAVLVFAGALLTMWPAANLLSVG